jgi:hypothetical protein
MSVTFFHRVVLFYFLPACHGEQPSLRASQSCPGIGDVTNTFGTESAIHNGNISHYHVLNPTSKYLYQLNVAGIMYICFTVL